MDARTCKGRSLHGLHGNRGLLGKMTPESLERIKLFVAGHRRRSVLSASNARENGYKAVAMEHQNEAALADLILQDLASEHGEPDHAL